MPHLHLVHINCPYLHTTFVRSCPDQSLNNVHKHCTIIVYNVTIHVLARSHIRFLKTRMENRRSHRIASVANVYQTLRFFISTYINQGKRYTLVHMTFLWIENMLQLYEPNRIVYTMMLETQRLLSSLAPWRQNWHVIVYIWLENVYIIYNVCVLLRANIRSTDLKT